MATIIVPGTTLETESCCVCGVIFAMPTDLKAYRYKNGGSFHCPNGHQQSYRDPLYKQYERQLEEAQVELRRQKCLTLDEQNKREAVERENVALGRKLNRARRGVCPDCKRTFSNLARHMQTKHSPLAKCKH